MRPGQRRHPAFPRLCPPKPSSHSYPTALLSHPPLQPPPPRPRPWIQPWEIVKMRVCTGEKRGFPWLQAGSCAFRRVKEELRAVTRERGSCLVAWNRKGRSHPSELLLSGRSRVGTQDPRPEGASCFHVDFSRKFPLFSKFRFLGTFMKNDRRKIT